MCCLWRLINACIEEFLRLTYRDLYEQVNIHNADKFSFSYENKDILYELPNPIFLQPSAGKFWIFFACKTKSQLFDPFVKFKNLFMRRN